MELPKDNSRNDNHTHPMLSWSERRSEVDSRAQQHVPGRVRTARLTEGGVLQFGINSHQVDSIKEVERIKAQLQTHSLRDPGYLFQGKVSIRVARIEESVGS